MTNIVNRHNIRQVFFFGLVGGASAVIDLGLFWLLTTVGVIPGVASAISFLSAFAVNYQGNKSIVFRATHSPGALWRYIALVLVNLGLSTGGVTLGVAIGLLPIIAKIITMVIVAIVNFITMRLWVFRHRPPHAAHDHADLERAAQSD